MTQVGTSQLIRFATVEVDLQAQELSKGGLRLKLTGQPFQVLAILLERPGTVVTRDDLQKRLWPDIFVDVDHNLNTSVRAALFSQHRKCRQIGETAAKEHLAPLPGAGFQAPRASPVGRREQ